MAVKEVPNGTSTAYAWEPDEVIEERYAKLIYDTIYQSPTAPFDEISEAERGWYITAAEKVLDKFSNEMLAKMPQAVLETNGVKASNGADTAPKSPHREYGPEQIFSRVQAVRKNRTAQYKNSRVVAHQHLGVAWTGLLNSWLKRYGIIIPAIPGWVVAAMFVVLKMTRICLAPDVHDSYIDGVNYAAITEECAVAEGELDDFSVY